MLGHQHVLLWCHGFHPFMCTGWVQQQHACLANPTHNIYFNTEGSRYCFPRKLACMMWTASLADPKPTRVPPFLVRCVGMAQQHTHCCLVRRRVYMYRLWPDTSFWPVSSQQMCDQSTPTIDSLLTEHDSVRHHIVRLCLHA